MTCSIDWDSLEFCDDENHYLRLYRPNLLQSPEYARAVCRLQPYKARIGLIKIDGRDAGLVTILEAGHPRYFHALMLDRGPLWYEGYGSPAHIEAFFAEFNRQFRRGLSRRRRIMPEISRDAPAAEAFQILKMKRRRAKAYQTIWLDLRSEESILFANFSSSWKKSLKKAEKAYLTADWDDQGRHYNWFTKAYLLDQKKKKYPGPSQAMLDALRAEFQPGGKMIIGRAMLDNRAVGAILLLCHGHSATYQIGWTYNQGREACANHFLLWKSLTLLKEKGVYDLDLGGVNDATAAGVKKFKQGLGGELTTLVGSYA